MINSQHKNKIVHIRNVKTRQKPPLLLWTIWCTHFFSKDLVSVLDCSVLDCVKGFVSGSNSQQWAIIASRAFFLFLLLKNLPVKKITLKLSTYRGKSCFPPANRFLFIISENTAFLPPAFSNGIDYAGSAVTGHKQRHYQVKGNFPFVLKEALFLFWFYVFRVVRSLCHLFTTWEPKLTSRCKSISDSITSLEKNTQLMRLFDFGRTSLLGLNVVVNRFIPCGIMRGHAHRTESQ